MRRNDSSKNLQGLIRRIYENMVVPDVNEKYGHIIEDLSKFAA